MDPNEAKLNFPDYYKKLTELQGELRNRICDKLEISYKTFYNKMNSDSWSSIERDAIDRIVEDFNNRLTTSIK